MAYPVVCNVAFQAWACHTFENGESWLIADVSIVCNDATVRLRATVAVVLYPVGLMAFTAALLYRGRVAIQTNRPSSFSLAIAFLYRDYTPRCYWFELLEMSRRFLLIGVFTIVQPGSVRQVAIFSPLCWFPCPYPAPPCTAMACATGLCLPQVVLAIAVSMFFLLVQLQFRPYRNAIDNLIATSTSFALVLVFVAILIYKIADLTRAVEVHAAMSYEQRNRYWPDVEVLSMTLVATCIGTLFMCMVLLLWQLLHPSQNTPRLLRLRSNYEPVLPPPLQSMDFHLFLSHAWVSGQDQMRVVKHVLTQMLPGTSVFLDVDDLKVSQRVRPYLLPLHRSLFAAFFEPPDSIFPPPLSPRSVGALST